MLLALHPMKPGMLMVMMVAGAGGLHGQGPISLSAITVHSPRVANQFPAGTFAMPISALRYDPRVDLQVRQFAESQADVTLRGGIFENTGFQLGAVTLIDPQTGHYLAEIPVAPALLGVPDVLTGAALAGRVMNASAGAVSYAWRPIVTAGTGAFAFGENRYRRVELYQGYAGRERPSGVRAAMDVAFAHSESDGAIPFGDHRFWRINGRWQRSGESTQTDLFAGYQEKFFGWPNLYTPFNSPETENLQTALFALNHRVEFGRQEFVEAGLIHRRNKDDYAFDRRAAPGPVHPFQHTTWVTSFALAGRKQFELWALHASAEAMGDKLRSSSLVYGPFQGRTLRKVALIPEFSWKLRDGGRLVAKAGATHDDSNREGSAISPVMEVARELRGPRLHRVHASYSRTTQVATYTALNSNPGAGLFRGNPRLGRASSHSFEVGAAGTLAGWTGTAAAFWRRDQDLVDWTFRRGITARTANPVDLNVGGFEVVAHQSWGRGEFAVGYTYLAKSADYRGAGVDASFYALNYARHRLTLASRIALGRGFELRLDNVVRVQAHNPLRIIGGDRALMSSAGLAFRPHAWKRLEFAVQVENAWNSNFQEVPAVPASPRQVSVSMATTW